jgi:hypothetical protein
MSSVEGKPRQRVLLFSERGVECRKWHTLQYEFEDVIAAVDDVHLLAPPAQSASTATRLSRGVQRRRGRAVRATEPEIAPVTIEGEYDLFFGVFTFLHDLAHLERLRGLRERCGVAVAFLFELFAYDIEEQRHHLELLREIGFDHVFVFLSRPAAAVAEIAGCPTSFLPVGVDALRFSPYPDPPPRNVDFYSFGRRSPVTHETLLDMVERDNVFYIYDTIYDVPVPDHRAHRDLIASILKRSRYTFAYRGGDDVERAKDDDPLSARYFECIGGGAVVLGSQPGAPEYLECFPWPDSTITIPYEAHDLREIVADLERQPARLARARMSNNLATLRELDWVYRWQQVLDVAGLAHTAPMRARVEQLAALAEQAEQREGAALAELA